MSLPLIMMMKPYIDEIINWVTYSEEYYFNSWDVNNISVVKIEQNKILITYRKESTWYWYWVVWIISESWITYGSEYEFHNWLVLNISSCRIWNNKVFISFWNTVDLWISLIATISWTTITYWTKYNFDTWSWFLVVQCAYLWSDTVWVVWRRINPWAWWFIRICTISWTTITYWTKYTVAASIWNISIIWNKQTNTSALLAFVAYQDFGNNSYWTWVYYAISWTSITNSVTSVFNNNSTKKIKLSQLDNWISDIDFWVLLSYINSSDELVSQKVNFNSISPLAITYWTKNIIANNVIDIYSEYMENNSCLVSYINNLSIWYSVIVTNWTSWIELSWHKKISNNEISSLVQCNLSNNFIFTAYKDLTNIKWVWKTCQYNLISFTQWWIYYTYSTKILPDWKLWTTQNMQHLPTSWTRYSYNDDDNNLEIYWWLYSYSSALNLPALLWTWWRLPTNSDISTLISLWATWWWNSSDIWNRLFWLITTLSWSRNSPPSYSWINSIAKWWTSTNYFSVWSFNSNISWPYSAAWDWFTIVLVKDL
jgi:hypothetical protein